MPVALPLVALGSLEVVAVLEPYWPAALFAGSLGELVAAPEVLEVLGELMVELVPLGVVAPVEGVADEPIVDEPVVDAPVEVVAPLDGVLAVWAIAAPASNSAPAALTKTIFVFMCISQAPNLPPTVSRSQPFRDLPFSNSVPGAVPSRARVRFPPSETIREAEGSSRTGNRDRKVCASA